MNKYLILIILFLGIAGCSNNTKYESGLVQKKTDKQTPVKEKVTLKRTTTFEVDDGIIME